MLAKKYRAEVVSIVNKIEGIYTVELKSLHGKLKFHPGQFLHLSIDSDYDGIGQWPDSRCFSIQSTPDEVNIKITYSVKGSFTRMMESELYTGKEIWLKLPYGDLFSQNHSFSNTVFIAGGTGITPYLSLFGHSDFLKYSNPRIYLGFKSEKFNIYNEVLDSLSKKINNQSDGNCGKLVTYYENINGLIDIQKIISENDVESSFFISGPPKMIDFFKTALLEVGISKENILTDDWG